jgi:hypothetical protein
MVSDILLITIVNEKGTLVVPFYIRVSHTLTVASTVNERFFRFNLKALQFWQMVPPSTAHI